MPPPPNPAPPPARGGAVSARRLPVALASLGYRDFRYFWIGGLISSSGRFFQVVALPVIIWDLTKSPGWVGFAGFAQFVPMAMMAPIGGPLADRHPRRKLLLVTQSLMALVALAFAAMWWAGVRSPLAFVAVSALAGLTGGLNLPAWQAFVSELVPRDLLLNAVTLNSAQFNSSRMIGPVLAGITVAAAGPAAAFVVNAASYVAVLIALALIDAPGTASSSAQPLRPVRNFVRTARYVRNRRGISTAIAVATLIGFIGLPIQVLIVVLAEDVFHRGPSGYGLMLTMVGAGAVACSPIVASLGGRVPRSRILVLALGVYGVAVVGLAVAPTFVASLVPLAAMGAAHLASASTLNTTVQLQVDEDRRAQVLALYLMMLLLGNPIGQLALGQMMELVGPRLTLGAAGVVFLGAAAAMLTAGWLRNLDEEVGSYEPQVLPEVHPTTPSPPRRHRSRPASESQAESSSR